MFNTAHDGAKLMYASGSISQSNVDFLVDSGASNNFISQQLVQTFGLDVKECNTSQVALPDGTQMEASQYIFEHVTLAGQQLPKVKFYILPILPATVLGLQFLQQRSVIADFASLKLSFKYSNKVFEVLGHTEPRTLNKSTQNTIDQLNQLSLTGKAYRVSCSQMKSLLKRKDVEQFCMLPNAVQPAPGDSAKYFSNTKEQLQPLYKQYTEQQINQYAKCAIAALEANCKLLYMRCPRCKADHLDEGKFATSEHIIHKCARCGLSFRGSKQGVGNPLSNYDISLSQGKLRLNAMQANVSSGALPQAFVLKARAMYDAHKHDVDQFVDNIFPAQNVNDICVQITPIKNILYLNSSEGREAHCRTYQRTTFYSKPNAKSTKPQVVAVNQFQFLPLKQLMAILQNENTLFLDNVFHVASHSDATQLAALLKRQPNVANSKIVVRNSDVISHSYCQIKVPILNAGSPLVFILSQQQEHAGLPPGSLPHLLDVEGGVQNDLRSLLTDFKDVFPETLPQKIPPDRGLNDVHHISIESNAKPAHKAPYKTGPHESSAIKKELDDLLASGLIQPSNSPWAAPVLLVKKPDGSLRFCIDYRGLNQVTRKDKYPLPRTQELIDKLSNAQYFSSFDLRSGYWQLKVAPSDINKTAFTTRYGQYEWLVMPFGLTNAPSTFQRVMHNIFHKLLDKCVVVYLDDILVYSKTLQEHNQHLNQVLQLLRQHRFYAKLKKCSFYQRQVTFLGHDIDSAGMHINDNKIKTVKTWPIPRNKHDVQRFIGFAQFFRQFIYQFSAIALPLTKLCSSTVQFEWSSAANNAFNELRDKLCTAPVLHIYDANLPIEVHTDASDTALSGILYQVVHGKLKPVAYHSRKFNAAECNYNTTERELLAIVDSCRHWRHYLYQQSFTIRTDHRPLQYFFNQPNLSPRQLRWAEYLSDFQPGLKILYLAGRSNVPADALTKHNTIDIGLHATNLNNMSMLRGDLGDVKLLQEQDSSLKGVRQRATSRDSRYHLKDGIIFTEANQLVLPSSLVNQVISEHHDHTGHFGIRRTIARIKQRYWFQHLESKVASYIKACDICQRVKPRTGKPVGKLQPLPVPTAPWQHVSMDFITDMPVNTVGGDSVYVVVDRFSKQTHLIPLTTDTSASACAKAYLDNIVRLHGIPLSIVSDRDPRFTARFWQELMRLLGTDLNMSTAFHPQTDGQTERTIRSVEQLLRAYCHADPDSWCDKLPQVELSLNTFPHTATGVSPHEVVYNTQVHLPIDVAISDSNVPEASQVVTSLQQCWQNVRAQLQQAQANMIRYTDKQRQECNITPDSLVMLETRNLQLAANNCKKLKPRYVGPFKVVKQVGRVSFKLDLPDSMKVHPVFHASLLKPYHGVPIVPPSPIIVDGAEEYVVDKITKHRNFRGHRQFLVRWKGYDPTSDEWIDEAALDNAQQVLLLYKRKHNL